MSEESTGTFGALPIGAVFRIPWTYQIKRKISATEAMGLSTETLYRYSPGEAVRQDWRTEAAANADTGMR